MDDPCNADASHFMQYERARHVLHRATREWLQSGAIEGMTHAELFADFDGRLQPLQRETEGVAR